MAEIKVGIMVPTTGSEATYGKDMENAIKMAVDEINAKGGVLGQKFTTVTADDGCDPQMATAAASKIVAAGVDAVVGGYCSGATLPTPEDLRRRRRADRHPGRQLHQVHRSEPGQRLPDQRHRDLPGRHGGRPVQEAGCQEDRHHPPGRRLLRGPGQPDQEAMDRDGQRGGGLRGRQQGRAGPLRPGHPDQVQGPDLVFWTAYYADGALVIKQLRAGGYKGKIAVGDGSTDAKLIEIAGKSADGVYALANPLPEFLTEGKKFIAGLQGQVQGQPRPLLGADLRRA
ncbi:MAG: branched-chain amino acid ABC transporter substrate-binding protein [Desulfobacterales bacterium]|nr:branched-chain amino acid ABC transporter substrate-binding protein [Desulfobacterales bacterium]